MKRTPTNITQTIALVIFGIGAGVVAYQIRSSPLRTIPFIATTPTPAWQEQRVVLTDIEQATMSGNFTKEFQQALETEKLPPKPSPIFVYDIPASMAGDITAPTITITGGPPESSTIPYNNPCFPLWVGDNMTPWQQLTTRAKIDDGQWSPWMNQFSYCFNNLENGGHTVLIQIKDLAGNVSPEIKRVFIVKQ